MRYQRACIALALGFSAATAAWGQSIRGVGDLPGGVFGSRAYGDSAAGGVGVGASAPGPFSTAFRWTAAGGIQALGTLPGQQGSIAFGVSGAGPTIVGLGFGQSPPDKAFRWTQAT